MQRILAVWAHPDDESFGPVGTICLAHAHGYQSMVVTATRGEAGSAGEATLQPNQTLGDLREAELRAATQLTQVEHLVIWEYSDGKLSSVDQDELIARVGALMHMWQPEIVITFGPDGITGHPDHMAISAATTAAFHAYRAQTDQALRLLYVTLPADGPAVQRMGPGPNPLPANTVLDVAAYVAIKRQALACHASQRADWQDQVDHPGWLCLDHFHQAYPVLAPATIQTSIFAVPVTAT